MGAREPSQVSSDSKIFESTATSLSSDGSAIVRHPDGRVFFVFGAWPGDKARFEIVSFAKRYGIARVKELIHASPDRQAVPCPHQGYETPYCGGCPWMIGSYASQLRHKEQRLHYAVEKSQLKVEKFLPILGSEELAYRNRAQFKTDGKQLGYVSSQSKALAPIKECKILNPAMKQNLNQLLSLLPNNKWKPTDGFVWNFIDVDDDIGELTADRPVNTRRPFKQGNAVQNQRMLEWIRKKISELGTIRSAIELYCGSGNFTEVLSTSGIQDVLAVEVSAAALNELTRKKLKNVRLLGSDLSKAQNFKRLAEQMPHAELLLLDPPREGAPDLSLLIEGLDKLKTILYVSCDVATFVRDAKKLASNGFQIEEIQPLDLFPQTPHVESLALFKRT